MSDSLPQSQQLADLPFDISLKIFGECDVGDVLNLSATCKGLNQVSAEHQTWLNQVTRLQIPIPAGVVPSTAELKNWVVSWVRSEELWVKSRDDGDGRSLNLHRFDARRDEPDEEDSDEEDSDEEEPVRFVMANFVPGGKFVVVLYDDGQIDLKEIKIKSEDKWDLRGVAQYKQDDPEGFNTWSWSQLLTETGVGRPLIAYMGEDRENLMVFLVDHVAGIIEQKQVVKLDGLRFHDVYSIQAKGNVILCLYEQVYEWGITVSELGPNPALKHFTLSLDGSPEPGETQFFMMSENAVVICDAKGIHLYHIPELDSPDPSTTLNPVWEWPGESKWFCGSVCMTSSQHPILYLQGTSGTHTVTFRMDACGRDPIVVKHHITGKLPAHLASIEGGNRHRFVMKGRKGLYYKIGQDSDPGFATCLLGREELVGRYSVELELPEDDLLDDHKVTLADFDERTGRILIGTDRYGEYNEDRGIRIYLADLPP